MSGAVVIKGDSEEDIVTGTVNGMTLGEKTDIIVGGFGVCCVGAWVDLCPLKMEAFVFKLESTGFEYHFTGPQYHSTGPQDHSTQSQTHLITGDETVTVTGDQIHEIFGAATHSTTGDVTDTFMGNMTEVVVDDKYETVGGNKYERVDGDVYHYHGSYSKVSAAFDLSIYDDAHHPTVQIGMVDGSSTKLALGHSANILATVGPFGGPALTSLKLVPASATLGSPVVNINGTTINLGQPAAPVPILTNLADILAGLAELQAAAAAAAKAAAKAAEEAAEEAAAEAAADRARFAAVSHMYG